MCAAGKQMFNTIKSISAEGKLLFDKIKVTCNAVKRMFHFETGILPIEIRKRKCSEINTWVPVLF
jgi:hypothetical protein